MTGEAPTIGDEGRVGPASVRGSGGRVTLAAGLGRARRAARLLGLLAAALCLTAGGGRAARPKAPPVLKAEEGVTVEGRLWPGETAEYTLEIEEGQYVELRLDRGPRELMAYLYPPGVEPTGGKSGTATWSELAPGVGGQVAWELAQATGDHRLLLVPQGDEPIPYRLKVTTLRTATARDRARQECDEKFAEAVALEETGKVEEAVALFGETLELCREGEYVRGVGATFHRRAPALIKLGRYGEARKDLETAFKVWVEIGERRSMAAAKVNLAALERRLARWDVAEDLAAEGLRLAREAGARDVEANALDAYCRIYLEKGSTRRAFDSCHQAIALWEELGRPGDSAESLNNVGYLYWTLGQLDKARTHYLQALSLLDRYPNPQRRPTLRNNLALLDETEGDYHRALEEYQAAAEGHEAVGRFGDAGVAMQNAGQIHHLRLASYDAALDYYRSARALAGRGGDPLARTVVLQSLGSLHLEMGHPAEARQAVEEALDLSRGAEAPPYLARSLLLMGRLQMGEGRPEQARESFEEALDLGRLTQNRWTEADALAGLGTALTHLGVEEQSLELLRQAAAVSQEIGDPTGTAETRYLIAEVEHQRGNLEAARAAAEESLGLVHEIREAMGGTELRTLFTATARRYHELYVGILMAQHERHPEAGHYVEALAASEEARARSLLEVLAEARLEPGEEVPQGLLEERARLVADLDSKAQHRELLLEEGANAEALLSAKLQLERLLSRLRDVERRIRAVSPRYDALTRPRAVSVAEIRQAVLDPETTLLEYFLGDQRSFLWVVTQEKMRVYELPPRDEIDRDARCLHWLITAFGDPPADETLEPEDVACLAERLEPYRRAAEAGHRMRVRGERRTALGAAWSDRAAHFSNVVLGGPSRDGLLTFRLAVVSDGALEYVPFASLPDPADPDQPLVRAHEVVSQPSASVLAFQRAQAVPSSGPAGVLAIVADPVYSLSDDRMAELRREPEERVRGAASLPEEPWRRYARLHHSGEEADLIASLAPEDRTFVALGRQASRETVLSGSLSGYRYVHFATHGTLDTRFPELSSLVLSLVDEDGSPRSDGFLRLNDVYGLELDGTDMVVLSACETALGREIRGEGLLGLTRGFQYAGAERVVSSLWQVQDRATARLMEHMYRGLIEEERAPADALRRAQLAVLDEAGGHSEFPYYWAGFVLQGEWR